MEEQATEQEYMAANPFIVAQVDRQNGAWSIFAHPTMRLALTQPKLPGCTPVVFDSWADYQEWKTARMMPAQ